MSAPIFLELTHFESGLACSVSPIHDYKNNAELTARQIILGWGGCTWTELEAKIKQAIMDAHAKGLDTGKAAGRAEIQHERDELFLKLKQAKSKAQPNNADAAATPQVYPVEQVVFDPARAGFWTHYGAATNDNEIGIWTNTAADGREYFVRTRKDDKAGPPF